MALFGSLLTPLLSLPLWVGEVLVTPLLGSLATALFGSLVTPPLCLPLWVGGSLLTPLGTQIAVSSRESVQKASEHK